MYCVNCINCVIAHVHIPYCTIQAQIPVLNMTLAHNTRSNVENIVSPSPVKEQSRQLWF